MATALTADSAQRQLIAAEPLVIVRAIVTAVTVTFAVTSRYRLPHTSRISRRASSFASRWPLDFWQMLIALLSSTPLHAVNRGGAVSSARVDSKASRAHRAGAHDDASFKVCVVGAGPCGLLFSNALLRQNADAVVEIFEQAPKGGPPHDGSSGFGLGKRACDAIDEVPGLLSEVKRVGTYAYLSKARLPGRPRFEPRTDCCVSPARSSRR